MSGFIMGVGFTLIVCAVLFVVLARFERDERADELAPVYVLDDFRHDGDDYGRAA